MLELPNQSSINSALKETTEFFEIRFTDDESNKIRSGLKEIIYSPLGEEDYITALRFRAYQCFPARVIKIMEGQRISKNPLPYIIFNNLPIDDNIWASPSFSQTGRDVKSGNLSENVICALATLVGEPYSISFESSELVNNLTPHPDKMMDYTGLGSAVELDFHIENAALKFITEDDYSPTGLFLLGVRHDPNSSGPYTFIADSRRALAFLENSEIDALYKEDFIIRLPHRWRMAFQDKIENTKLCPMISGPVTLPRVSAVFYADMVLAVNQKARKAFEKFHHAIKTVAKRIKIIPGQMIYIDNRFALHSREKFTPTYDDNNTAYRWIQRVFIAPNLWSFRSFSCKGERVFNPSECTIER